LNTFEIVTTLTIASIGTIILLYFVVLKKKGWLTEEIPSDASYLCPNPQCRKVFLKPITLTDLSISPPRSYLGCPHCGLDLATIPHLKPKKTKKDDKKDDQISTLKPKLSTEHLATQDENIKLATSVETRNPSAAEVTRSAFQSGGSRDLGKPMVSRSEQTDQTLRTEAELPSKSIDRAKLKADEKPSLRSPECTHFFGYVKRLPKNAQIPDECMWCPQLVKCLTGDEMIEA